MPDTPAPSDGGKKKAGAFDIRNIIGALLGIYGVILVVASAFGDQALEKTGGIHANLWAGLALVIASVVFLGWARMKPIVVPDDVSKPEPDATRPSPGGNKRRGQD